MRLLPLSVGVCLLAVVSTTASAAELTSALTVEQVECQEGQMEKLLTRLSVEYPESPFNQVARTIQVSPGADHLFEGVVSTNQDWRFASPLDLLPPPEHYLAFHINPTVRSLLLNPARLPIGQASLTREDSASNLKEDVYIDTTLRFAPKKGGDPTGSLAINNLPVPAAGAAYEGFLSSSVLPGRGLEDDGLLDSCQALLTEFDRHVFSLLQRMLRAWATSEGVLVDTKIAVFRGADSHTYRVDVYPIPLPPNAPATGKLALEVAMEWTPAGALTQGVMRVLANCSGALTAGCTNASVPMIISVARPTFGGHEYWRTDVQGFAQVTYESGVGSTTPVGFAALLAGTTWNVFANE